MNSIIMQVHIFQCIYQDINLQNIVIAVVYNNKIYRQFNRFKIYLTIL